MATVLISERAAWAKAAMAYAAIPASDRASKAARTLKVTIDGHKQATEVLASVLASQAPPANAQVLGMPPIENKAGPVPQCLLSTHYRYA